MKIKRLLIPLLLFAACAFVFAACDSKDDNNLNENPPYNESEIEEFIENYDRHTPFIDNQIVICLTEEVSFKNIFHDYTVKDFSEIGAVKVEELDGATDEDSGTTYLIRQCLLEDPSGKTIPEYLKNHNRFFCITLDKNDEHNVLRAVYILRQRSDIYIAEPNHLYSPDV